MMTGVDDYAELIGFPTALYSSGDEVEKLRSMRKDMLIKQQQLQQGLQAASMGAGIVKDLSHSGLNPAQMQGMVNQAGHIMQH